MANPDIRFVKYDSIDFKKWDQCIANSPFGIAYGYSWYLDRICEHWDALIWGDYLYVMPLVNRSKWGIQYIYQPFFTQQLGIFSNFQPEPAIVNRFLLSIPKHFRLTDMNLNVGNIPTVEAFSIKQRVTHHLYLLQGFSALQSGYSNNTRRNIQKAVQHKIYVAPVYDLQQFVNFTEANLRTKSPEVKREHYLALQKVISFSVYHQVGEIYGAWDSRNNLVAAAFFLTSNQKSIYLAASSNEIGTEQSAMFLLVDTFIKNYSGKNHVLDFEGSLIPGVARFYAGFGARPQVYYSVHQNRLPKLLRYIKR